MRTVLHCVMHTRYDSDWNKRSFLSRKSRTRTTEEGPIRELESRYRTALSGAVVAKACYLAQMSQPYATAATIDRARWKWERIDSRRRDLAAQLMAVRKAVEVSSNGEVGRTA